MNLCGAFVLLCPCTVNDYSLLAPTNARILLIYIAPYLAATCFILSPYSWSSQANSLEVS